MDYLVVWLSNKRMIEIRMWSICLIKFVTLNVTSSDIFRWTYASVADLHVHNRWKWRDEFIEDHVLDQKEKEQGENEIEREKKNKRHMDRGSHCPIDVMHHCDVKVIGQGPSGVDDLWFQLLFVATFAPLLFQVRQIQGPIESI